MRVPPRGAGAMQGVEQVDPDHALDLHGREVLEAGVDAHRGAVDPGVDAPEALGGLLREALDLLGLPHVGPDHGGASPLPLDLGGDLAERPLVAGGEDDGGAPPCARSVRRLVDHDAHVDAGDPPAAQEEDRDPIAGL